MELLQIKIDEIKKHPKNPRIHPQSAIDKLVKSIDSFGWTNPLLISSDGYLVAGHARVKAAEQAGIKTAPAIILDIDGDSAIAYMIADNKLQEETTWDMPLLKDLIKGLSDSNYDLELTGFTPTEIEELIPERFDVQEDGFELDKELEEIEEPITQLGDKWYLGDHILICGDAEDEEVYKELLGEDNADMVITDPPYNVDYHGSAGQIINDNLNDEKFNSLLNNCFTNIGKYLVLGGAYYVFYSFSEALNFVKATNTNKLRIRQNLIWVKNQHVLGRQDYQWKHEPVIYGERADMEDEPLEQDYEDVHQPIIYGWKEGARHKWYGGFDKTTVIYYDKPLKNDMHPTMKPIGLCADLIQNSSRKGDIVMDTFGGSGTTLMASEKTGRIARLIELDPKFCDVIVKRYVNSYGNESVRHEKKAANLS